MAIKLALVAAMGHVEGPWIKTRGNEKAIFLSSLNEGCDVQFEFIGTDNQSESMKLTSSSTPFPHPSRQYRVVKQDLLRVPVSVQIHFE